MIYNSLLALAGFVFQGHLTGGVYWAALYPFYHRTLWCPFLKCPLVTGNSPTSMYPWKRGSPGPHCVRPATLTHLAQTSRGVPEALSLA